jgi:dolichyl-phosphate beta-glucosyltransferase
LRSLSVIVPAFNEERRLPETLTKLAAYLEHLRLRSAEILVVDDGSTDGTVEVVNRFSKRDSRFCLLRNPGNRGKGYAVRHGMLKAQYEWRLMTDADLSTPIEEVTNLYQNAIRQDASVAIGSRALNRKLIEQHQPLFREFGGRFFNLAMRAITGLPFTDTQCGFKLYRADTAQEIFSRQILDGFSFDVEDVFIAHKLGCRIVEVPVVWANSEGTKVTVRATVRAFADLLRIRAYGWQGRYR